LKLKFRPILVSAGASPAGPKDELIARNKEAKAAMRAARADVHRALAEYEQTETIYQRGLDAVRQEAQQATAKANETFQKLIPILEQFENNAKVRLLAALQLLSDPTIAGEIEDATALQHEAAQLEPVFSRLAQAFGPLQEL